MNALILVPGVRVGLGDHELVIGDGCVRDQFFWPLRR
jgi:hypothetical protein